MFFGCCQAFTVTIVTANGPPKNRNKPNEPKSTNNNWQCDLLTWLRQTKEVSSNHWRQWKANFLVAIDLSTGRTFLKEICHNILSHFFNGLNCEPKNNGLLRKKNTKGLILKQNGARMIENGEDWNRLEMAILKTLAIFFKMHVKWWRSSFKQHNDFCLICSILYSYCYSNIKLFKWDSYQLQWEVCNLPNFLLSRVGTWQSRLVVTTRC